MDEEILKNLENISENLEYLIEYFQSSKENKPSENNTTNQILLENISNDFSTFNFYLKSIDNNIQLSSQKMSAYLDSISTLDNNVLNDNPEYQQTKIDIDNLIVKIDELKNSITNTKTEIGLNIDTSKLDKIKEQLQSDFLIGLDITKIDNSIDEINKKLSFLNNIPVNFNVTSLNDSFSNSIKELNILKDLNINNQIEDISKLISELNKLKDLNLDNLDLNIINSNNLDFLIESINKISELSNLNLDDLKISLKEIQDINLDNLKIKEIKTNLEEIQNINLDNLKVDNLDNVFKIDLDTTDLTTKINILTTEFEKFKNIKIDLDLNLNLDLNKKIEEMKTNFQNISNDLKNTFSLDAEVNYKNNPENIQTIKNEINNIDIILTPDDELSSKIKEELNKTTFDIKINPINENPPIIETKNEIDFKTIKQDEPNIKNDMFMAYMEQNNKILEDISKKLSNNSEKMVREEVNVPIKVEKHENIISVSPNKLDLKHSNNNSNDSMVFLLNELVLLNKNMLKKMTKNSFNTDLEI